MSEIMDKAIAYSRQERQVNLSSFECEKLGTTIYYKPLGALSVSKFDQVLVGENKSNVEGLITILMVRALDVNGERLFKPAERVRIEKEWSPLLIAEIVKSFGSVDEPEITVEELEKN